MLLWRISQHLQFYNQTFFFGIYVSYSQNELPRKIEGPSPTPLSGKRRVPAVRSLHWISDPAAS